MTILNEGSRNDVRMCVIEQLSKEVQVQGQKNLTQDLSIMLKH